MASEIKPFSNGQHQTLLNDFKAFYTRAAADNLDGLNRLYTQDVEFRDPAHTLHGLLALKTYMRGVYSNVSDISLEYLEEQLGENRASVTWDMRFSHRRLNRGRPITVRGVTQIRFTDRIYYHEDFFDLGAMLYQHIPVLGFIINGLKSRLQA